MKNICSIVACLLISFTILLSSCSKDDAATIVDSNTTKFVGEESFDAYNAGGFLGLESNSVWTTWYNNPGSSEDAVISNEVFRSSPNAIKIKSAGADTIDVVLPLGNLSSGQWDLSFWMHIQQGHGAYFNVLHAFEPNASNWAAQFWFSKIGHGHMTVGGGALNHNFTHPRATWFQVKININIDEDLALLSIDGEEIVHWTWSEGSMNQTPTSHSGLAALSFISAAKEGSNAFYYVDDISFRALENDGIDLTSE